MQTTVPTEAALERAFGEDLAGNYKVPTGTASFKTKRGVEEYFLSLPFPVSLGDLDAIERDVNSAFTMVKAAVLTNAGIPWELDPEGRPFASIAAAPQEAAAQVAPAVQQRSSNAGGNANGKANTRDLGADSQGRTVYVNPDGKYGPYVSDGVTIAKVPASCPVEDVTLEKAIRWIGFKLQRQAQGN